MRGSKKQLAFLFDMLAEHWLKNIKENEVASFVVYWDQKTAALTKGILVHQKDAQELPGHPVVLKGMCYIL